MRRRLWMVPLLVLPLMAGAHEGEAHGKAPEVSTPGEEMHVLAATGDVFEVVLKHPEHAEGPKTPVRVLVSESATNAPVSGAQVELTLTGASVQSLVPKMASPGLYVVDAELAPEVELAAVATVTRGDTVDVLALGTVHVEAEHEDAHDEGPSGAGLGWGIGGGAVLLVVAGAWWVSRRKGGMS
ncbi:hypothetical protein ACLESD_12655 [Pyxidicoccus sp. 3LFB2]